MGRDRHIDHEKFEEIIAQYLREAGYKYVREPSIGGLRPDFLVEGPEGQRVVVEAKAWEPGGGNTARALEQVKCYERITQADKAFLVFPFLRKNYESKGLVSEKIFLASLKDFFKQPIPPSRKPSVKEQPTNRTVFAAMPFDRKYDDTYFVAMSHAAEHVNAACERVDLNEFSGDIVEQIKTLIKDSIAVIADLSEAKANVLYEVGYSHAIGKPTVHICSTPLAELPFDVRNWNTLEYKLGQTSKLRDDLARRLRSILQ